MNASRSVARVRWLVVLLAGCGTRAGPAAAPPPKSPVVASEAAASGQAQLSWYLAALAGSETSDDTAVERHFTPEFLAHIPAPAFRAHIERVRASVQRLEVVRQVATPSSERVHAVTRAASGAVWNILLAVEAAPPYRITFLLVRPEEEPKAPPIQSWIDADRALRALAPRVALLAADLDSGACVPIQSLADDESLAVGSAYKLFVLGALAREVETGARSWSDPMSGDAPRTLSSVAERMIANSDNVAADDLVVLLGRETIERFAQNSGAADARLAPLLLTRETFALKYAASEDERARFVQGNRDQRLSWAKEASTRKWDPPPVPSGVATVGWFASLRGLCNVTAIMHDMAKHPRTALVGRILAANPGLPDADHRFAYVGYKGGSEPGILNVNFLLQRASDGKWMYLGVTLNDEKHFIDQRRAMATIGVIRSFVAASAAGS